MAAAQDVVFLLDCDNTLLDGRVLFCVRKEQMLDDLQQRYPTHHYVMVDDKLRILSAMKKILRRRLTTVFPRQGHYARDPDIRAAYPPTDLTVERIGDLLDYDLPALFAPAGCGDREKEKT